MCLYITLRSSAIAHTLVIKGGMVLTNFACALCVCYYGSPSKKFLAIPLGVAKSTQSSSS